MVQKWLEMLVLTAKFIVLDHLSIKSNQVNQAENAKSLKTKAIAVTAMVS